MSMTLLGWRRTVTALYSEVRSAEDVARGWQRWRDGRDELFAEHPDSPVDRSAFDGLKYWPYDPALRFEAPVEPAPPERIEVPTTTDGEVPFERVGVVRLGDLGSLDVWWLDSYGGGIFVPFRDATCGVEAYGGGRYLIDTVKGADLGGSLTVDLNFAYNPSCAYDSKWACPLPPPGNVLAGRVEGGERTPY